MLFVVTARHSAEMCPAGVVHPDKQLGAKVEKAAKQAGAKLVEVYLDGPGHTFYTVLEAATNAQLWDATEPLRVIGDVQFAPVMRLGEALKHARKLGIQK
jgi:uncharacterized protein DUF3303